MKEKVKENILPVTFAVLLFILFFSDLLKRFPTNLDELWNYNTARCIKNGLIPYKEISMITTPLLPTIVSVILKITADQLLVFRVLHALLVCGIFYLSYRILLKYKVNKYISIIFTGLIVTIFYKQTFLDYNYFCLFLMLIIENLELKSIDDKLKDDKLKNNKKRNILIGLLAGFSILTKQTLGFFICLFSVISPIIIGLCENNKVKVNKENKVNKEVINTVLLRILGISIPGILFVIYLLITNSFLDFINYAVLGIKTFSNSITYIQMIKTLGVYEKIIAILIPFVFIIDIVAAFYLKDKKYYVSILSSLSMLIVLYPICDYTHFLVGTLIIIINLFILLGLLINKIEQKIKNKTNNKIENNKEKDKDKENKKEYLKFLEISLLSFIVLMIIYLFVIHIINNIIEYNKKYNKEYVLAHYENIPLTSNNIQNNKELKEFYEIKKQEGYNVIIVDADACFYTIPLDVYNKNYDMFLKGNIGKDGEDGIIDNIKNSSKTIYLLKKKEFSLNWQTPTKVLEYIRNNLNKTAEFSVFEVWE